MQQYWIAGQIDLLIVLKCFLLFHQARSRRLAVSAVLLGVALRTFTEVNGRMLSPTRIPALVAMFTKASRLKISILPFKS